MCVCVYCSQARIHTGFTGRMYIHLTPFVPHLVRELCGAHHFNDVEGRPADVIAQHLELKGLIKQMLA